MNWITTISGWIVSLFQWILNLPWLIAEIFSERGVLLLSFAIIFFASYFLTHKIVPAFFILVGRILGFQMKFTPLTAKRVQRFKSIRRGYVCFTIISSLFVMSLGLELLVNNKPLYIRYTADIVHLKGGGRVEGRVIDRGDRVLVRFPSDEIEIPRERIERIEQKEEVQYPAVANWIGKWSPFWKPIDLAQNKRFGLDGPGIEGDSEVDYRQFSRWVKHPVEALEGDAKQIEANIEGDKIRFRKMLADSARHRNLPYDPQSPLPPFKLEEYKQRRNEAAYLRSLQATFASDDVSIWMPLIPFSPLEKLLHLPGRPPLRPSIKSTTENGTTLPMMGTDSGGQDVLAQVLYGFRIGLAFALLVTFIGNFVGVLVGGAMGYYGGWFDILLQRFIEIWSAIPFLFTLMILSDFIKPSFWTMVLLLLFLRAWIGLTNTMRGEFYREKARDYVQAAQAIGVRDGKVMTRHILPNALVPLVTYTPFEIVAYISTLVSLDYLGFGLGPDTPSWGNLLKDGSENISNYPHLITIPILAFALTLFCVVMVGEAVREGFDPKKYARLH